MSEADLLAAILSTPSAETKPKPKPVTKREKKVSRKTKIPEGYVVISRDELKRLIEEAVRRGIQEGIRLAKEVNERNIVETIWNSEPSGVKLSNLVLVFGRDKASEIQSVLYHLLERNILVKDRNNWWHINPAFLEDILQHYQIAFTQEECEVIRERLRNRFARFQFDPPSL